MPYTPHVRNGWAGLGLKLGEHVLMCLVWADDTWLFAAGASDLSDLVCFLKGIDWQETGLQLRPEKRTWARAPAASPSGDDRVPAATEHIQPMKRVGPGECLKVLGA